MTTEPVINIGIITADGAECTTDPRNGLHTISRVIIGKGFHWQRIHKYTYAGEMIDTGMSGASTHDSFRFINRLPIEQYLQSVIASEMNPQAPIEFLKAHAIISRSWALRKLMKQDDTNLSEGKIHQPHRIITWQESDAHTTVDLCSDDHCQRYQGTGSHNPRSAQAVKDTRGIVLWDEKTSQILDARFSKCCAGTTAQFSTCWADTPMPYPAGINDPYCNPEILTPQQRQQILSTILKDYDLTTEYYDWHHEVTSDLIRRNLQTIFKTPDPGKILSLVPLKRDSSGRVSLLAVHCQNSTIEIGKELAIRRLLSDTHLPSSAIQIQRIDEETFRINGRGWGHGVGLCQIGAAVMASLGHTAREILAFYYPGITLRHLY